MQRKLRTSTHFKIL